MMGTQTVEAHLFYEFDLDSESEAHPNDGKRLSLIRRKNRKTQAEFAAES